MSLYQHLFETAATAPSGLHAGNFAQGTVTIVFSFCIAIPSLSLRNRRIALLAPGQRPILVHASTLRRWALIHRRMYGMRCLISVARLNRLTGAFARWRRSSISLLPAQKLSQQTLLERLATSNSVRSPLRLVLTKGDRSTSLNHDHLCHHVQRRAQSQRDESFVYPYVQN